MVIEHSRYHIDVLRSLSLVSKDLRKQVVGYLFDRVTLSTAYTHYHWMVFVEEFPDIINRRLLKLLIIESGGEDVLSGSSDHLWGDSTPHNPQRILDEPPQHVLLPDPPISEVDTLVWTPTQILNQHSFPTAVHILSSLVSLTNIHMIRCRFTNIQQLQSFLGNCGQLRFLELHGVAIENNGTNSAQPVHAYDLSQLKGLRVYSTSSADWVVDHILSRSIPNALRDLSIESSACFSGRAFTNLIRTAEASLTRLSMVAEAVTQQDLETIGALSLAPPIQHLTIALSLANDPSQARMVELLQWCSTFIGIFPQTHGLSGLVFALQITSMSPLRQIVGGFGYEWLQLLQESTSVFPHLTAITIHITSHSMPTQAEVEEIEPYLKSSPSDDVRVYVQWVPTDPGRYLKFLPDGFSPLVALASRSN
ncbi:hypothetical protein PM082_010226 [Marasmius tenuissimus]|nr:hypothetical protein PM082_010226 [Marasmius tenuissimus]